METFGKNLLEKIRGDSCRPVPKDVPRDKEKSIFTTVLIDGHLQRTLRTIQFEKKIQSLIPVSMETARESFCSYADGRD